METSRSREVVTAVYPRTGRPVAEPVTNPCYEKGDYLPVVRYEAMYYPTGVGYCGVFYFYEPDSTNWLGLGKVLVAANKVDAMLQLEAGPHGERSGVISSLPNLDLLHSRAINALLDIVNLIYQTDYHADDLGVHSLSEMPWKPEYLLETYRLITHVMSNHSDPITIRHGDIIYNTLLESFDLFHPEQGWKYLAEQLVGMWDYLDQYICHAARRVGYDTVIFQRELGVERVVTEILDTRPRSRTMRCHSDFRLVPDSETNQTIWFVSDGVMRI